MVMQLAISGTETGALFSCTSQADRAQQTVWVHKDHPDRESLQNFIATSFFKTYGAKVRYFCETLVGCKNADGEWIAALGFSLAKNGKTFLEQYLDAPLENEIAAHVKLPICRNHIVEVGNLAATHVGAGRELIICMTKYLHQQGLSWVAFTATAGLLNSFIRLRLNPHVLAVADPARMSDGGKSWGTYYATKPKVMFGDIRSGYAQLA